MRAFIEIFPRKSFQMKQTLVLQAFQAQGGTGRGDKSTEHQGTFRELLELSVLLQQLGETEWD